MDSENSVNIEYDVRSKLFSLQDEKYRDFVSKLIPNKDKESIIGIRSLILKKFSKKYLRNPEHTKFMGILPHKYFEEYGLHINLLEKNKNYEIVIQ